MLKTFPNNEHFIHSFALSLLETGGLNKVNGCPIYKVLTTKVIHTSVWRAYINRNSHMHWETGWVYN